MRFSFFLGAATLLFIGSANAQTLTVQVLDGHSGKPLSSKTIEVSCLAGQNGCAGVDEYAPPPEMKLGQLIYHLPSNANVLWLNSSEDQYTFCAGWEAEDGKFSTRSILTTGILAPNHCGHPSQKRLAAWQPQPGRIVIFVSRKPWWVRILPYC